MNLYSAPIIGEIYAITQAGYGVRFGSSMEGMIEIEYIKEYDGDFYELEQLGTPGGPEDRLQEAILNSLKQFREMYSIPEETLREPS